MDESVRQASASRRRRHAANAREAEIIAAAVAYFSLAGHAGTTHELARRLGISQPLLYRYFPTKKALLDRVYVELHQQCWRADWTDLLRRQTPDFPARLAAFYRSYIETAYRRQWLRIFLFTALSGGERERNRSYVERVERDLIDPICEGTRHHFGAPPVAACPISAREREAAWHLHGGAYFTGLRRELYEGDAVMPLDAALDILVRRHLEGYPAILPASERTA
jgi:AcrR family transcriptional regulator